MKLSMKILILSIFLICVSQLSGLGLMFFADDTAQVFDLEDYSVSVRIENQAAVTVVTETFRNSTFLETSPIYAFGLPLDASVTQLHYTVNDTTYAAELEGGDQGSNPGQGSGYGDMINEYLGENKLIMPFEETEIGSGEIFSISLTYVVLLPYSNGDVTYSYPTAPFAFHNNPIPHGMVDLELFSQRTITGVNVVDGICTPVVTEEGNYAHIVWDCLNVASTSNTMMTYTLDSEELGMFGLSTLVNPNNIPDTDDNGFFLFVTEPDPSNEDLIIPKMFTLILDNSGSMSGDKIVQARDAASYIVNNLNDDDLFNIVRFNSSATSWSSQMETSSQTNVNSALQFISSTSAGGGTNISGAFSEAVPVFDDPDNEFAKIIIFLTDGQATVGITQTSSLVSHIDNLIQNNSPDMCLFTFGIGESVNTSLLTQIAMNNNGFPEFLGDDVLEVVITDFYNKVRNPVLINPSISVEPDVLSSVYPNPLPSVYVGNQLLIAGRYDTPGLVTVNLSGTAFGQDVTYNYDYTLSNEINNDYAFLTKIWAGQMLEHMVYEYYLLNPNSSEAVDLRQEIIDLSIAWGVMCEFTHYVDGGEVSNDEQLAEEIPNLAVKLHGNYPNPFNPSTTIKFEVFKQITDRAIVKIYNVRGELVKILVVDVRGKGMYEVDWDGTDKNLKGVASGTYFYTINVEGNIMASKMLLLK